MLIKTKKAILFSLFVSITISACAEGWLDSLKSKLTLPAIAAVGAAALVTATGWYASTLYKNRRRSLRAISTDGKSYDLPENLLYGRKDIIDVTFSQECNILDKETHYPLGIFAKNNNNQLVLVSTPTDSPNLLFGQHLFDCECDYAMMHLLNIVPDSFTDLLAKNFDNSPHA